MINEQTDSGSFVPWQPVQITIYLRMQRCIIMVIYEKCAPLPCLRQGNLEMNCLSRHVGYLPILLDLNYNLYEILKISGNDDFS